MNEKFDINNRTLVFNMFRKSKEEIDEEIKKQEEQDALEEE